MFIGIVLASPVPRDRSALERETIRCFVTMDEREIDANSLEID